MKIAPCRWCGSKSPQIKSDQKWFWVQCKCGAYGWMKESKEKANRVWSGDEKGNGYHQNEGPRA